MSVEWYGPRITAKVEGAMKKALAQAAEMVGTKSDEICPVENNVLIPSRQVTPDRDGMVQIISYNTEYAVKQHEDLTLRHDPGRKAKYLETALEQNAEAASKYIAKAASDALKGMM